ncbi:MAG: HAD-IB family phosphatase [Bryobacteraceae bacterium]
MPNPEPHSVLVTDFDGTITRHDFYELALSRMKRAALPDYWEQYASGRITHFEAMRGIFSHVRGPEERVRAIVGEMEPDPKLGGAVERLRRHGWEIVVVSAGCAWYIDQVLEGAGVKLEVHASPGRYDPERGLQMELPAHSPYCSVESGIDKEAAVREALLDGRRVAFAGNGPPDLAPSLLVDSSRRFARGWLAQELRRRRKPFRPFEQWSEIASALTAETAAQPR